MHPQLLHAISLGLALASSTSAQLQFGPRERVNLSISPKVTSGDFDGDGHVDLVFAEGRQNRILLNDGLGQFRDETLGRLPFRQVWSTDVAVADIDADGDLDALFAVHSRLGGSGQNLLYINDGSGRFSDESATRLPARTLDTWSVTLADVDGDGDVDAIWGNDLANQNDLYLNDGTGHFTDVTSSHMPRGMGTTAAIAAADIDGDGDLDLALANHGQNTLLLNDGAGRFLTLGTLPRWSDRSVDVEFADIDGNGDPDLVFANGESTTYPSQANRLYLNQSGRFVDATNQFNAGSASFDLATGDMDEDGDIDVAFGYWRRGYQLLANDGAGTFADVTPARLPDFSNQNVSQVAWIDVDLDRDRELVCSTSDGVSLFRNLRRHLFAPNRPRVGQPFQLEATARFAPAAPAEAAFAFLSANRIHVPTPPYGVLLIDLTLALPPAIIPQGGTGLPTWNVPNVPAIAGIPIHGQAFIVSWPGEIHLSNLISTVIGL